VDHGTILDAARRVSASGAPVTALSIAADLQIDDPELLEDIGDAIAELVDIGRLVRVESRAVIAGQPAPFPTVTYSLPAPG
jgi:hypothetical protein